jgi:NTE family protein
MGVCHCPKRGVGLTTELMAGAYLKSLEEDDEASKLNEAEEGRSAVSRPPAARLRKSHKLEHRPPFDCIALLLQGGGALGAYQAGVYEALAGADLRPDWVVGTSIGGINSAIIAGNPRERRVAKLREFWELVSRSPFGFDGDLGPLLARGDAARAVAQQMSAITATMLGVPGFYAPRIPSVLFQPPGTLEATSFYDTTLLKATLERLVDFDLINSESHDVRLSLGSVNARSGQLVYFDSTTDIIRAEHVMASGALPPWFPAVEIDGEYYWDGGVVSNTPLEWLARHRLPDTLAFQVDLWAAPGELPKNVPEVMTRMKEILNSSRTIYRTDGYKEINHLYATLFRFLGQVPEEFKRGEDAEYLVSVARRCVHHLVNLVYRPTSPEGASKDDEFSRRSIEERWLAGYRDTVHALRHPDVLERAAGCDAGIFVFDFPRDGG